MTQQAKDERCESCSDTDREGVAAGLGGRSL